MAQVGFWNHNVHYQPVILQAVPAGCGAEADFLAAAPAVPVDVIYRARYRERNSGAPVKDPEMTWAEVRAAARRQLPGVCYRRHLLWRYSLLWRKPA
jgi:hypothetical protein